MKVLSGNQTNFQENRADRSKSCCSTGAYLVCWASGLFWALLHELYRVCWQSFQRWLQTGRLSPTANSRLQTGVMSWAMRSTARVFMTPKCVKKLSCERSNSPRGLKTRDPSHSWMGLSTSWTGWYRWVEKLYLLSVCLRRTVLLLLQWRQTPIQQQALQQRPRPNSGSSEGRTKSTPPKFILLTALCRNINWKTITAAVCLQQMEILMQRNNLQANRKTA